MPVMNQCFHGCGQGLTTMTAVFNRDVGTPLAPGVSQFIAFILRPGGTVENSPAFQRRVTVVQAKSPGGTAEKRNDPVFVFQPSLRDSFCGQGDPALKRRAMIDHPSGTRNGFVPPCNKVRCARWHLLAKILWKSSQTRNRSISHLFLRPLVWTRSIAHLLSPIGYSCSQQSQCSCFILE